MEAKQKALEICNKFTYYREFNELFVAKQCALICVDEIINSSPSAPILSDAGSFVNDIEESTQWWKEVKTEIEKL